MSKTDNTAPYRVRVLDTPEWSRYEIHEWCENETIDSANTWLNRKYGRAVYEKELVKYVDVEVEYVKMIDSNRVKFEAEVVRDWRRGKKGSLVYDREAHPGAVTYTYPFRYGGEIWNVRTFRKQIVATPVYRNRLVGWEYEPRRKCDLGDPNGLCHYSSHLAFSCSCCTSSNETKRQIRKSHRQRTRSRLNEMAHEYNSFGEVGDDPPPRYRSDSWWG